jgi:hypothetical protein
MGLIGRERENAKKPELQKQITGSGNIGEKV